MIETGKILNGDCIEVMRKRDELEVRLNLIVQKLRLTIIKHSILNATSNNAINGR